MDEGRVEQERESLISVLFQEVSEDSVSTAFRDLDPKGNPSGAQAAQEAEKRLLGQSNPNVLADLKLLLESYIEDEAKQMFLGALIFHRVLRTEAQTKGMTLPTLTEQFVRDYARKKDKSVEEEEENFRESGLSAGEAARAIRKNNIRLFKTLEPKCSEIVEEKLNDKPNWRPEDDFRYTGIIYQYFLFRAGYKDPKNFQNKSIDPKITG